MDVEKHYEALFGPVQDRIGPIDSDSLVGIVGFDGGGPISLSTIGVGRAEYPTYVTCALSVRDDQRHEECPPFEVLIRCNDQGFAWNVLTALGDLSLQATLGPGHIVHLDDLAAGGVVAILLEEFARVDIAGRPHAVLQAVGLSESLLRVAAQTAVDEAVAILKREGVYPNTIVNNGA
jgi:hypothetical protein